jgi:hypothetical protein
MLNLEKKVTEEDTSKNEDDSTDDKESEETDSKVEDKSSKEDSKSEEDTDDSEDISKIYFTDPDSLDPKLRGAFKKMQGVFTKKMQEATLGIKKASAFDQLVLDPEFRAWMEERHNRASGKTSSKKTTREDDDDDSSDDDEDEDTPMTRKALRTELQGIFKTIAQEGNKKEQAEAMKSEAAQFKKDNPDWEIYKEPIMSLIERHPTLSYQDAYDLAVREDSKKENKKETMETKKRANINKPSKTTGKTTEKKGKMSVREAFDLAKKSLGI